MRKNMSQTCLAAIFLSWTNLKNLLSTNLLFRSLSSLSRMHLAISTGKETRRLLSRSRIFRFWRCESSWGRVAIWLSFAIIVSIITVFGEQRAAGRARSRLCETSSVWSATSPERAEASGSSDIWLPLAFNEYNCSRSPIVEGREESSLPLTSRNFNRFSFPIVEGKEFILLFYL